PAGAVQLHEPLAIGHDVPRADLGHLLRHGDADDGEAHQDDHREEEGLASVHPDLRLTAGSAGPRWLWGARPTSSPWCCRGGGAWGRRARASRSSLVGSRKPPDDPWMTSAISPPATSPSGLLPVSR